MDDERLLADYLHNSIDNAKRAQVEQLLRTDPQARERLADLRRRQQQLIDGLAAELRAVEPPPTLTFAAIEHKLAQRRPRYGRFYNLAAAIALLVMILALLFSLPGPVDDGREVAPVVVTIVETFPSLQATPALSVTQPTYNTAPSIVTRTPTPLTEGDDDQFSTVPTRTAP